MRINWRKWNRVLHRDLGYLFFGMSVIYALSGIALNHVNDWNPSYIITQTTVQWDREEDSAETITKAVVLDFLQQYGESDNYKKGNKPSV